LFRIESKVGARLTKGQLRRYRLNEKGEYLVVVTKRAPEVESAWLRRNGIFAMRWQDVHRALDGVSARGTDRYLCLSFNTYLEELRMAHREDIRADDLKRVSKLFERTTATHNTGLGAEDAFRLAADCLAELDELMTAALDAEPKLRKFSKWGPNYYKWFGPNGDRDPEHLLFFHFHTGQKKWHTSCGAGFVFQANGKAPQWQLEGKVRGKPEKTFRKRIESVCRDGLLDKEKMLRSFVRAATKIGVID
jgi:hypothetical protein